jgi:hypothetical protein
MRRTVVIFPKPNGSTIKTVWETLACRDTELYRTGSKTLTDSHITLLSVCKRKADPDGRGVCGRLIAGVAGSNPSEVMGVRLLCLFCVL